MSMQDPIADMFVRIRNAQARAKRETSMPASKQKKAIAEVLKSEGYITVFDVIDTKPARSIKIGLKYGSHGESVITEIKRISKSGLRIYTGSKGIKPIIRGYGITILTTSRGVLSDRDCRKQKLGGEVLCTVK